MERALGETIPVVHVGQLLGVRAVERCAARWLTIRLSCSRLTCRRRLVNRGDHDIDDRLRMWDRTAQELTQAPDTAFDMTLDTDVRSPEDAATMILSALADDLTSDLARRIQR